MDSYINEEVLVPEGDEAKSLHTNKLVMAKRIIADSIKDHLIPQVSSLKTPKAMIDSLTKLFEGKNINRMMQTLRNQLKNVKIQNAKTIQSYFTRVSQIKEKLEAVDVEVENEEIVMTTLNGLPRSWDSFIQGICARKKLVKFSRLWEECSQEEARIAAREENMGSEYQALTIHSKKTKRSSHHSRGKHFSKNNSIKYFSRGRCYTYDEVGHFAKDCPKRQNKKK